jgi:hypothetical protein
MMHTSVLVVPFIKENDKILPARSQKNAERQTSLEQASFDRSQVSSRVFAKAPLLPASFLLLL